MTSFGLRPAGIPLAETSVVATRRGLPWWAAVVLAFVLTGAGIGVDLARGQTLTRVFLICYGVGCVLAVLGVMRRGLFAAMVQPPLIFAVAVPIVVRLLGSAPTGSLRSQLIALALPLVNGFPTMAVTTALTVTLGLLRLLLTRRPPAPQERVRGRAPGDASTRDTAPRDTAPDDADTDVHLPVQPGRSMPARSPRNYR